MPRITARHESLPLTAPFRISRGVKTAAEVVVVEAEQDGVIGRGEAVPYARYDETVESVLAQIAAGGDLPPGAARNAVDLALWDLTARRRPASPCWTGCQPATRCPTRTLTSVDSRSA